MMKLEDFVGKRVLIKGEHPRAGQVVNALRVEPTMVGTGLLIESDYSLKQGRKRRARSYVYHVENVEMIE